MTKIKITNKQGKIAKIEVKGHSGYAESGSDIVCAGISSIVCSCHLGLVKVLNLKVNHSQNEKLGEFSLELLEKDLSNENAQILLKTAVFSLEEIAENYKKFVQIEIGG